MNGILYFTASQPATGKELWRTDGTAEGTWIVKDIEPREGRGSEPRFLTGVGHLLFFEASEARHGIGELWCSDGSEQGTVAIDLRPGNRGSSPHQLVKVGNSLYFAADDNINGEELWRIEVPPSPARFSILATDSLPSGNIEVTWESCPSAQYVIEESGDLVGWSSTGAEIVAEGDTTTHVVPRNAHAYRYFRVRQINHF